MAKPNRIQARMTAKKAQGIQKKENRLGLFQYTEELSISEKCEVYVQM